MPNEMDYQGIGIRLAAQIVDGIISFLVYWFVGIFVASRMGGLTPGGFELHGYPALICCSATFGIIFAYFLILEGVFGQTLGKKLCKIKVVKEDGSPCDLSASFIRNILRIIDGIAVYLVGAIFIARSDKKQRLGDRVASTIVIKK
ncbi:MAG: RDD family protein [Methanocellales archaeon]|nr:RDD family protein [Methanocellales archaeon]